jgi:hypothetical protein
MTATYKAMKALHDRLERGEPLSPDEERLARSFAHALADALNKVLANQPDFAPFAVAADGKLFRQEHS